MVDLTLERPGEHLYIRSVALEGIRIVDRWYTGSIVISRQQVVPDWPPGRFEELGADHFDVILELQPDVVLIGTGRKQRFLPPELLMVFYGKGIGAEVMTTAAACRTFNVLVSEGRKVVAALLPPGQ